MRESAVWNQRAKAIAIGIGTAIAIALSANWWQIYSEHVPACSHDYCVADFVIFYAQPLMLRENPAALYDLDQQLAFQQRFVPTERVLIFPYPPITAALLAPFTLLSFSGAFLAMTVVNVGLIWSTLRRLIRELHLSRDQTQWLVIATVCNFGIQATVANSHGSIVMLYILARHVLAQRRRSQIESGFWAGWLCLKPQYAVVPHLILSIRGTWRSFFIGAVLAAGLIGVGFLILGWHALVQYLEIIMRYTGSQHDWTNPIRGMYNLRAIAEVWLPVPWSGTVWIAAVIAVATALIWLNRRAQNSTHSFEICWINNAIAMLLLSPHVFTHDLSLLVIPSALVFYLWGEHVPLWLGIMVVMVVLLPAANYLLPTIMATALLLLFIFGLRFAAVK